jgi:hypothetical protein
MGLTWADVAETVVGGLSGVLGVYATQEILSALRRRGLCPHRWTTARTLVPGDRRRRSRTRR